MTGQKRETRNYQEIEIPFMVIRFMRLLGFKPQEFHFFTYNSYPADFPKSHGIQYMRLEWMALADHPVIAFDMGVCGKIETQCLYVLSYFVVLFDRDLMGEYAIDLFTLSKPTKKHWWKRA